MTTCPLCGDQPASKSKATHHRRVCRPKLAARLAAAFDNPLGLVLSGLAADGSAVSVARVGPAYTLVTRAGSRSFKTAVEAAAGLIDLIRPTD